MKKLYSYLLKQVVFAFADKVMKTNIIGFYNDIRKMDSWDEESVLEWQNSKLQLLVQHAYNTVPYYKRIFDKANIKPSDIKKHEDLKKIPVLTREDAVRYNEDLISTHINKIPHKKSSTGGTTGKPLSYMLDNNSWSFSNAHGIFSWEKTGYKFGEKYIALGSSSLFVNKPKSLKHKIFYKLKNKVGLSGTNMSDDICKEYVAYIKKHNIKYVYGYASAIYLLAQYVITSNIVLNLNAVITTSEVLQDNFRSTITKAFSCKIVNCYGAHDSGVTAYEFSKGFFEVGYGAIVRVENQSEGAALITDLFNYAMPFINYKLGDEVKFQKENSNYNGQLLSEVKGRTSDIIELNNGSIITGRGFNNFFNKLPIKSYHIKKKDGETIICQICKKENFTNQDKQLIIETLQSHIGKGASVEIEYVFGFKLSNSGKRKQIIV